MKKYIATIFLLATFSMHTAFRSTILRRAYTQAQRSAIIPGVIAILNANGFRLEVPVEPMRSNCVQGLQEYGNYTERIIITFPLQGTPEGKECDFIIRKAMKFPGSPVQPYIEVADCHDSKTFLKEFAEMFEQPKKSDDSLKNK